MPRQVLHVVVAALVLATNAVPASTMPLVLSHEGFLVDEAGLPAKGSVRLRISFYDDADGGAALWWEEHHVTLVDGYYALTLGQQRSLENVFGEGERYLGVAVGGAPDILPRRRVAAVPYAIMAINATGDITPRSISIGQRQVIDARGVWTGPPQPVSDLPPYQTAQQLLAALRPIDGPGSKLDADTVDGRHASDLISGGEKLLAVLRAVDGPGSGVDADTLDGHGSADFIVTALQLRNALVSVDGTGSELDFDLLDGLDSSQLLRADQDCRVAGNLTVQGWVKAAAPQADADLATKSYVDGQVLPGQPCPAGEVVRGYDPGGTATCVQAGPPVVSGITPERGPASGGTVVTVTGGGFRPGVRVFVGTSEAGNVVVVDGASLTALTGVAQQTGIRQAVSVVSAGGLAGVLPAAFSYESEAPGL